MFSSSINTEEYVVDELAAPFDFEIHYKKGEDNSLPDFLTREFSPGSSARARIAKDFQRKKWKLFRKWFFKNFSKVEQHEFQEEFYKDLIDSKISRLIPFVPWFMCKHVHNYISMLERDFTLSNGEITRSVFPPQQSFQINKNDKIVNFNAFSKLLENDTALVTTQHVNAIIKQNNYANI